MSENSTIPQIDHSFWLDINQDLYWPSAPINLKRIDKLSGVDTEELVQNFIQEDILLLIPPKNALFEKSTVIEYYYSI